MKTKTTQSQQIIYASMLVIALALSLSVIFNNLFYGGIAFGFIMGLVVGATFIQTKITETKKLLEQSKKSTEETKS